MIDDRHRTSMLAIQDDPTGDTWDDPVRAHVAGCDECRASQVATQKMVERLRARSQITAPPELVAELRARIHRRAHTPRHRLRARLAGRGSRLALAVAAGLALGLGLGRVLPPIVAHSPATATAVHEGVLVSSVGEYLDDVTHDRHLLDRTGRPLEHLTSDRTDAGSWLSKGLGFDVAVGSAPEGWQLEGARVWHTVSRLSALVVYEGPSGSICLFAVPDAGLDFSSEPARRVDGHDYWTGEGWNMHAVAWRDHGLAWSAVADLDTDSLLQWVESMRAK